MLHQNNPPNPSQLAAYNINIPSNYSGISFPLYDSATAAAAGQSQLTFFQTPAGSGSKTFADTNMVSAGQVQSPNVFVLTGLEVLFISGAPVEFYGTAAAQDYVADVRAFYYGASGATKNLAYLELDIGSAFYVREPLFKFPPSSRLAVSAASSNATTAAASSFLEVAYAENSGIPYQIAPLALPQNQNFQVTMNWTNGVTALPSTTAGKVYVTLNGWMYRPAQG